MSEWRKHAHKRHERRATHIAVRSADEKAKAAREALEEERRIREAEKSDTTAADEWVSDHGGWR